MEAGTDRLRRSGTTRRSGQRAAAGSGVPSRGGNQVPCDGRHITFGAPAVLVTGVGNLYFRGLLRTDVWTSATFWSTSDGQALAWKLTAVGIMVAVSAIHDFVAGPAAARLDPTSRRALPARRRVAWLARINVLVGIVLVVAAVRLARGG